MPVGCGEGCRQLSFRLSLIVSLLPPLCLRLSPSGDARACGARRVSVRVCAWCAQGPESQTVSFSSRRATVGLAKAASSITPLRRYHTCCTLVAHLLHTCCTLVASFARVFLLRLSLFAALCVRQSAHGVRPPSLLSLSASRKLVRAHTPGRTHLGVAVPHSLHGLTGGLLLPQTMAAYEHPVREGVPDCTFYIKTGQCKFGSSCKYNHPPQVLS